MVRNSYNTKKTKSPKAASSKPAAGGSKKGKKEKDTNAPKRPLSAYFLFAKEKRPDITAEHPEWRVSEVASEMGRLWKDMDESEKQPFVELAAKEKKRYEKEMEAYRNGTWGGAGSGKAGASAEANGDAAEDDEEEGDEESE